MARQLEAEFLRGARGPQDFPPTEIPEAAIAGRSNVGKSTLINRLTGAKGLARTSATPGRTQEINFFKITSAPQLKNVLPEWHLVDLPGFGFAQLPAAQRREIEELVGAYVNTRSQLKVLCLLNDCRREPQEEEISLRALAYEAGRHVLVIGTKADKLKRSELAARKSELARAYGLQSEDILFTGEDDDGRQILQRISALLKVSGQD